MSNISAGWVEVRWDNGGKETLKYHKISNFMKKSIVFGEQQRHRPHRAN